MDPPTLLSQRNLLLEGVDPMWVSLIDTALLDSALGAIDDMGDAARSVPPPGLIFEALRYGAPSDIIAVIVDTQGPSPTPEEAQGICFSVGTGANPPIAVQRIFDSLDRAGLRREHAAGAVKPDRAGHRSGAPALMSGDLRSWAVQGVLMINTALTTRAGADTSDTHAAAWKPFTDDFLRRFCAAARSHVHFLLWGGEARAVAVEARRHGHTALEWSHPGSLADSELPSGARFRACPHFEEVNAALAAVGRRPVIWDNLSPAIAFSDGSCTRNGKPGARASFAALVTGGQFGAAVVRGEVSPTEYAFLDEGDPARGICETHTPAAPSNNRGELLGIIYAFMALLRGRAAGRVELVSDSKISINTLLTFLPARLKKKTEHDLKNFDLLAIAWRLLGLLREQAAYVVLTHTHSHLKPPPASASSRERFIHRGNAMADKHAALALPPVANYAIEVLDAPAVMRALARPNGPTRA